MDCLPPLPLEAKGAFCSLLRTRKPSEKERNIGQNSIYYRVVSCRNLARKKEELGLCVLLC